MTHEEIKTAIATAIAADDSDAMLALITLANVATVKKYTDARSLVLNRYAAYRSQITELATKTDAEMDAIYNQ